MARIHEDDDDDREPHFSEGMRNAIMFSLALLAVAVLLFGCNAPDPRALGAALGQASARPIVRSTEGGNAALSITACASNDYRAQGMGELIRELMQQDEMVVASNGGSARLVINTCPGTMPTPEPARPTGTRR